MRTKFITVLGGGVSDTTAPTCVITSTETSPSFANPIPITFTLSEVSVDFAIGDVTVGAGGTLGNFAGSGMSYTADLTITSPQATVTLDVAANAFHDAAGNGNTAATQFSITSALIFKDAFTTDDNAPLTSPRTHEPGPGNATITDTENKLSISGGELVCAGGKASPGYGDPGIVAEAITRAVGLIQAVRVKINSVSNSYIGFKTLASAFANEASIRVSAGGVFGYMRGNGSEAAISDAYSTGSFYTIATILRSIGAFYVVGNKLRYVADLGNTATLYPSITNRELQANIDYHYCGQLGAPWNSDYGIATSRVASASVGEVITGEANALIEMTWQAVTGQTWNLYFRRTDDTHTLCLRLDETTDTIKLIKIDGSETELASAAHAINNGANYRPVIVADGDVIAVAMAGVLEFTVTDSYNNNVTGIKTDRAGTNLIAYPRTLSGAALTELQKLANP